MLVILVRTKELYKYPGYEGGSSQICRRPQGWSDVWAPQQFVFTETNPQMAVIINGFKRWKNCKPELLNEPNGHIYRPPIHRDNFTKFVEHYANGQERVWHFM